jgi:hypothetical protein
MGKFAKTKEMEISHRENYFGKFKDKRLDRRAHQLSSLLYFGGSVSIHEISSRDAEQKAAYRFLSNKQVKERILIKTVKEKSAYLSEGRNVLVLQDTTEINLNHHRNRLHINKGVGLTGNNYDRGFFFHCSLVLDADTQMMLGFSDVQLWHRLENKPSKHQRDYKKLPISKKESNKWIRASRESKKHLSKAASITIVEDREGDIFEQFAIIPDHRTHLIIRSRENRKLSDGGKLFERLAAQPVRGQYSIDLVEDIGTKRRKIDVAVRFCEVNIARPELLRKTALAKSVKLHVVEVRQINGPQVGGVLWRILTTHSITNYPQALDIVNKYRQRWHIEQLFRLLKKRGFDIESSELETGWAIRKLTIMTVNSALRVMQLRMAYNNDESRPMEEVFDKEEIQCLKAANATLQGDTAKMKNTRSPETLSWATWVVARLGGWKPYDNRPPGPIILKRGLDQFAIMYKGWKLALRKDVS